MTIILKLQSKYFKICIFLEFLILIDTFIVLLYLITGRVPLLSWAKGKTSKEIFFSFLVVQGIFLAWRTSCIHLSCSLGGV